MHGNIWERGATRLLIVEICGMEVQLECYMLHSFYHLSLFYLFYNFYVQILSLFFVFCLNMYA